MNKEENCEWQKNEALHPSKQIEISLIYDFYKLLLFRCHFIGFLRQETLSSKAKSIQRFDMNATKVFLPEGMKFSFLYNRTLGTGGMDP